MSATALLFLLLASPPDAAPDTLRLARLQRAAVEHDPRIRQLALQEAATDRRLRNIAAERLPAFVVGGQASHQSEVAAIPVRIPDAEIPTPPHDRYEATLSVEQLVFDGGALDRRRAAEEARLRVERARIAAALYPLRSEVGEAFFAAFLLQQRRAQLGLLIDDLSARLALLRAQAEEGAALPGDTAQIRAEMLRAMQEAATAEADRAAALAVLSELVGMEIAADDALELPDLAAAVERARSAPVGPIGQGSPSVATHPRYELLAAERAQLDRQSRVLAARTRPRLSAFAQLGYGSPGYAQFTDDPHDYWIAGLRLSWQPWTWGTNRRDREILSLQQEIVDSEAASFAAELRRQVQGDLATMDRLAATLAIDDQIITLREQVERQALAQLTERAITPAAYVDARTDFQEARLIRDLHRVELARARSRYLTRLGVEQ